MSKYKTYPTTMTDKPLNIYKLISNNAGLTSWDYYYEVIVVAPDEETAKLISPQSGEIITSEKEWKNLRECWAKDPKDIQVELIGVAKSSLTTGLVVAPFHSG